jgi:hypothetical protein
MMKTSIALVAALALAGVGCSKKDGGSSAAAGGGDCTGSISRGVDKMAAARSGGKDLTPEIKAKMDEFTGKMKDVIIKRCNDDKWPAEVIACFETVSSRPEMMKCQSMLPQDQQDRVRNEVRDLMMSAGGLGRMNRPHGGDMQGMHGDMGGPGGPSGPGAGNGVQVMQGSSVPAGSAAPAPAPANGSSVAAPAAGSAK